MLRSPREGGGQRGRRHIRRGDIASERIMPRPRPLWLWNRSRCCRGSMVGIGSPRMWKRYVGVMGVHTVVSVEEC